MGLDEPRAWGRRIFVIYPRPSKAVMVTYGMNKIPRKVPPGEKKRSKTKHGTGAGRKDETRTCT